MKALLPENVLEKAQVFAGVKTLPPLLLSDQITVPLLTGWLQPAIILPSEAIRWPAQRLLIAVCHELAHFRRGDSQLLPLICLVRVLYWWHPLVWLALARLRRERENACDDLVLNQNFRATDYADLIVEAARRAHEFRWQNGALAMASTSNVGERIGAILNPGLNRRPVSRTTVFTGLILAFALGWFFIAAQVQAQDTPSVSDSTTATDASKPQIQLEFKLIQIDEKTYLSHQKEIDTSVANSDLVALINLVNNLPGASLLSAPSVTTQDGLKANVDIVRAMRYATRFDKDKDGKMIPSDFKTRELGLSILALPTLVADRRTVDLWFRCQFSSLGGWKETSPGVKEPVFDAVTTVEKILMPEHGCALWVGGPGTTHAYLSDGNGNNGQPSPSDTAPKRILLLINARPVPAEISKTPPKPTASKPAVKIHIVLVNVDEKIYQRQDAAMDEAIRSGDLHFFDNPKDGWVFRTTDLHLLVGQNGWYSEGEVQSYIGSAKQEMRSGKLLTTLQATAVFLGLNADFSWSKDRLTMDSAWQVTEPASYKPLRLEKVKAGALIPSRDLPEAQFHVTSYTDKGWDVTPGKEHAFWVGETLGDLRDLPMSADWKSKSVDAISMDKMVKNRTPSRLAVFLTAQPVQN